MDNKEKLKKRLESEPDLQDLKLTIIGRPSLDCVCAEVDRILELDRMGACKDYSDC